MSHHTSTSKKTSHRNTEATGQGKASQDVSMPAIRHVGPTLESDPEYLDRMEPGGPTPEAQIAALAGTAEPPLREVLSAEVDPLSGEILRIDEPERLKTRLPGDTSSDPHTDMGPDNAATLQQRGEEKTGEKRRKQNAA